MVLDKELSAEDQRAIYRIVAIRGRSQSACKADGRPLYMALGLRKSPPPERADLLAFQTLL